MRNVRRENGFMTIEEIEKVIVPNNTVYDVHSLLISTGVEIGKGNTFYPNVLIEKDTASFLTIGSSNIFSSSTHLVAAKGGRLLIGDYNLFSDGVIVIKSNMPNAVITIENETRLEGIINIYGISTLESGSQVLGNISMYNCHLQGGGSYISPDVEHRAGLLKGFGLAKDIVVGQGMVINGAGAFLKKMVEPQTNYHKK